MTNSNEGQSESGAPIAKSALAKDFFRGAGAASTAIIIYLAEISMLHWPWLPFERLSKKVAVLDDKLVKGIVHKKAADAGAYSVGVSILFSVAAAGTAAFMWFKSPSPSLQTQPAIAPTAPCAASAPACR